MSESERDKIRRKKANRYATGASDKAMESEGGIRNFVKENKNPDTNVLGYKRTMQRIRDVGKEGGNESDSGNARRERLEALLAVGELTEREYKKRKKEMK